MCSGDREHGLAVLLRELYLPVLDQPANRLLDCLQGRVPGPVPQQAPRLGDAVAGAMLDVLHGRVRVEVRHRRAPIWPRWEHEPGRLPEPCGDRLGVTTESDRCRRHDVEALANPDAPGTTAQRRSRCRERLRRPEAIVGPDHTPDLAIDLRLGDDDVGHQPVVGPLADEPAGHLVVRGSLVLMVPLTYRP